MTAGPSRRSPTGEPIVFRLITPQCSDLDSLPPASALLNNRPEPASASVETPAMPRALNEYEAITLCVPFVELVGVGFATRSPRPSKRPNLAPWISAPPRTQLD